MAKKDVKVVENFSNSRDMVKKIESKIFKNVRKSIIMYHTLCIFQRR